MQGGMFYEKLVGLLMKLLKFDFVN